MVSALGNGDHPSNNASGCSVHPCGKGWADSDLLFKDPPSGLTLHRDSDKEIKYVVVALPELIDKDRFFPEGEVAIQAAPLTHAFPAVTDHLGRDMGKQPVYSLAIVRDAHVSAGGFNRYTYSVSANAFSGWYGQAEQWTSL